MRPIIGVNGDRLWQCGDVCHSHHPYLAPGATWEAQEYAHRHRSRVKLRVCVSHLLELQRHVQRQPPPNKTLK